MTEEITKKIPREKIYHATVDGNVLGFTGKVFSTIEWEDEDRERHGLAILGTHWPLGARVCITVELEEEI